MDYAPYDSSGEFFLFYLVFQRSQIQNFLSFFVLLTFLVVIDEFELLLMKVETLLVIFFNLNLIRAFFRVLSSFYFLVPQITSLNSPYPFFRLITRVLSF